MSEELQRIGLKGTFKLDEFNKNAGSYRRTLQDANRETAKAAQGMAQSMSTVSNQIDLAGKGWQGAVKDMLKAGASVQDVARFFGVSADEVRAFAQASDESTQNSIQAAQAADQQAKATKKAGAEAKKSSSYFDRFIKRLLLYSTVGVAVRGVLRGITSNLKEGFKALYENTEESKNLATATDRLRNSFTASLFPLEKTLELMEKLADRANKLADVFERESARRGIGEWGGELYQIYEAMRGPQFEMKDRAAVVGMMMQPWVLSEKQVERLQEISDKYNLGIDVLGSYNDALEKTRAATQGVEESDEDMARATEDLIDILQSVDEELGRHAQALQEIHRIYDEEVVDVMVDFANESKRIATESAAEIEEINADAAADIEKIRAKALKRIQEMEARARRQNRNDEERHQLEMEFARRRFQLSQIQNERMYQARRRRLVGEGDVLAIEELDEQYELQKQAQQENFNLQMQQAEAMYRLQAKIQEESMRAQMAILQQAMREQIAEREAARQKEIEEAELAAQEELELEKAKRDQALQEAAEARDEELAQEAAAHKKRMDAIGQQVVDFANKYDIEMGLMDKVIERHWGPGSLMDVTVQQAFERWKTYAAEASAYIGGLMGPTMTIPRLPGGGRLPRLHPGLQTGTPGGRSAIYSRPGLIPVAEGGRSERVSVQPMYPTGNVAMSLSWTGGPIPVRGEGSLSGADLDSLGSSIAIAIVSRSKQAYQNMYAPGG